MKNSLIYPHTDKKLIANEIFRNHILVSYEANYCNHCMRLKPVMDRLSLKFSKGGDGIIFDRFDLDENDFDFLDFDKVPKVFFYPKGFYD